MSESTGGAPDAPGTVIGGYTIERALGAGGMGAVYAVRHPRLPRVDALKVMPMAVSKDPTYRARFAREADLAARLDHPNIVPVYDRGDDNGRLWMSMKLVPGVDASALLASHPRGLPIGQVLDIVDAVASALDYAHSVGLMHRDVKPGNILIDTTATPPRVMLGDFGIARAQQDDTELTQVGTVVGTLDYASPEQLSGERVDGRSDEYSLAGTAVQMLTGSKPYGSKSGTAVIRDHLLSPPPAPSRMRAELPVAIDAVIARAMAKDPRQRYPSCVDFARALRSAATATVAGSGPTVVSSPPFAAPAHPAFPPQPGVPSNPSAPLHRPVDSGPGLTPAGSANWGGGAGFSGPGHSGPGYGAPAAPGRSGNGKVIALVAGGVVALLVLGAIVVITARTGGGSSTQAGASTSTTTTRTTTTTAAGSTVAVRNGYIDPCRIPASAINSLGISTLADDPNQRGEANVAFACKGSDSTASNADVRFATFRSSSAWETGTPVALPGSTNTKWRSFTVPSTNKSAPDFCITAYKSMSNGVLYVGMQMTGGRDCARGKVIAAAITDYLPQ